MARGTRGTTENVSMSATDQCPFSGAGLGALYADGHGHIACPGCDDRLVPATRLRAGRAGRDVWAAIDHRRWVAGHV